MAGPIRHQIDIPALEHYLTTHIPTVAPPLDIKQFGFGQSNPTYLLTSTPTGKKYVLRKKPPGQLLSPSAHQVEREYKVLKALGGTEVPAPKVEGLCEDDGVVGSAFYIMEYLDGRIFPDPTMPGVSAEDRTKMWKSALSTLAKLHKTDYRKVGLEGFGKPSGFYSRQIKTLGMIEDTQAKTKDVDTGAEVGRIPKFDEMISYFTTHQPQDRPTLIHGDYKIDNLVFHRTLPHVIGILDWELSTIGHPLADLANLLSPWLRAADNEKGLEGFAETPGLPSRESAVRWYSDEAGWDGGRDLAWGDGFQFMRNSVIAQGILARLARRQASSAEALQYGNETPRMARLAWQYLEKSRLQKEQEDKEKGAKL